MQRFFLKDVKSHITRWLLPASGLLVLAGYFGPWVNHRVAGLVITGLDLGEYVKFLPVVRGGQVALWREGFYLPLVAVSLICSLYVFRAELYYHWSMRALLIAVACVAALNLLPPAWTPQRLATAEFRLQTLALIGCLAAVGISPFLALLPPILPALFTLLLSLTAMWFPVENFERVLPNIAELYHRSIQPGWGMYGMAGGLILLAAIAAIQLYAAWIENPFWGKHARQSILTGDE